MGSAQLDTLAFEEAEPVARAGLGPVSNALSDPSSDLKSAVTERLRAHRERRRTGLPTAAEALRSHPAPHHPIAAAVAERFAQTPSYRAILAEQARLATLQAARDAEHAAAEAEVAARNAQAIAEAQQQLLAELALWDKPQQFTVASAEIVSAPAAPKTSPKRGAERRMAPAPPALASPIQEGSTQGLTVRLYEDLGPDRWNDRLATGQAGRIRTNAVPQPDFAETEALDELDQEIAFRQSPVFEPFEPTTPLPANLLEFPRQLVAARKARPRVAEGPLGGDDAPRNPQLRIFEVEPYQISTAPASTSVTPEWASIHLGGQETVHVSSPSDDLEAHPQGTTLAAYPLAIQSAPYSLRLMAASVDLGLVAGAFLAFVAVVAKIAHSVPTGMTALFGSAAVLAVFHVGFQLLFFTLSDQTPGMRYARIGLCTFTDENPARSAMRRRIATQAMAVCPLGLGLLWALVDDDGLGWHDRLSRMYQRAY